MKKLDKLRYPIGNFEYGKSYSLPQTRQNIKTIARFPKDLKKLVKKMPRETVDTTYRPGGWTVRQVVHHLADSHMNAYVRMKLAVTEPAPIIKPYEENLWAETNDAKQGSIKNSLQLLNALHKRWVNFLETLSDDDLERGYFHPERQSLVLLPEAIALYAWHCKHHLAHIALVARGKVSAGEEPTVVSDLKKRGRPRTKMADAKSASGDKPKLTRAEILAKARAARATNKPAPAAPAKTAAKAPKKVAAPDAPKMTRAEILAKARAARATNKPASAAPAKTAAKAPKKAAAPDAPKMTRAEIMAKARAARATNKPASAPAAPAKTAAKAPKKAAAPDAPKLTRAEIMAKARAARATNKPASASAAPAKAAAEAPKKAAAPDAPS
ncbi:MAG: putative metal-dependent hydrolase [Lewinellaceae bacterium]|nr:putative metal-dependent hydrolase [Lewinellaceae bacterium]